MLGYIGQWLERLTADQQVPGSNPGVPCAMEGAKLAGNAVPKFGGAGVHEHNKKVSTTTSHIRKVNAPNLFCGSERPGPPLARASSFP